ncbi:RICIN domain-containing protein [Longispora albida]|uniref:RICIN domain-containing protein n=1 Tax=Longispora albida TaxID=203523 RepID=UPI0003693484|nr:ricin-type beta-trefoil lectin domain protein [Longispora albida]
MRKLITKILATAVIVPAVVFGAGSAASAADGGTVTWKNKATGKCLAGVRGIGMNVLAGSCGIYQSKWTEYSQSDGTWLLKAQAMDMWCLDSNANGSVYTLKCNGGNYQKWYQTSTSTGWQLKNKATGRCLDSNANGEVYTLACNGGNYQRWA